MSYRKKSKQKFDPKKLGKRGKWKPKKRPKPKGNRGLWPTHQFIRKDDPINEQNTKKNLSPDHGIKVDKIPDMVANRLSKDDELIRRNSNNEKLNKADSLKLENIINKRRSSVNRDIEGVKISGMNHSPITEEGKFMQKMIWLKRKGLDLDNKKIIAHMYLKINDDELSLESLNLGEELVNEYRPLIEEMNRRVSGYDMIHMQLNELATSIVPLNQKGFKKLEDFQVQVVKLIDENEKLPIADKKTILVKAPTSAGKTALAGYLFHKKKKQRFVVCVPTNALAWQLSAMITEIVEYSVPLITDTYQSRLNINDLIKEILRTNCVVGTPSELVDVLGRSEFKDIKIDWFLFDEIHMLDKPVGSWMEALLKAYPETPLLALSATIGNENELADWFRSCGRPNVEVITYEKRFINLQRFIYRNGSLSRINPLSMIDINEFMDESVLKKSITPTPQDAYQIYQKLLLEYPEEESIKHQNFFDPNKRLNLDDVNSFFNHHLRFMINKFQNGDNKMITLVSDLQLDDFEDEEINLIDLFLKLKEMKKCPAIVFHKNSSMIMNFAYNIHQEMTIREEIAHPKLRTERLKHNKGFKKQQKRDDREMSQKRISDSQELRSKLEIRNMNKVNELEKKKAEELIKH